MKPIVKSRLSLKDLREMCQRLPRHLAPATTATKEELVELLERTAPRAQKPRMRNRGVGRRTRQLLTTIVGQTLGGQPIGLSYQKILQKLELEFPDSMVDARHIAWYATTMRSDGKSIPAERERSKWQ